MIGSNLTVFRNVRHQGRVIAPGAYVVGNKTGDRVLSEADAKAVLTYPEWAKIVEAADDGTDTVDAIDLSGANDSIKAVLSEMSADERDAAWKVTDHDAMAEFLVERDSRERKDGWTKGAMGNMIEKFLEV